jgi:hypothetical protein
MTGFERSTVRLAQVALGISILAAIFVCLQWWEMHSGATDTHTLAEAAKKQADKMETMSGAAEKIRLAAEGMVEQDKRIADNAQKSLDASNRQSKAALDASIASSREDQRAWLGVGDETYSISESSPIESTANVSDTGKSPALDIFCRISGVTETKAYVLSDSDIVYPLDSPILKEGTLFPNQHFPLKASSKTQMAAEQQKLWFQNVQNGDWIQYFFCKVWYKDAFRRDHWTHFCTEFVPSTKAGTPCPIYNETDDSKTNQAN